MKEIYCVYLTFYKGNKLPKWYIGSSNENKILKGYNGSIKSKKWKEIYNLEQKENKHLFKTRILSKHDTREEALKEELRLQKKHFVVKNKKYFNESYASINGYFGREMKGEAHPQFGKPGHSKGKKLKPLSEERKIHLSVMLKGRSSSNKGRKAAYDEDGKKFMCNIDDIRILNGLLKFKEIKQKRSKEEINKSISESLIGRKIPEEVKIKISNKSKGRKNSKTTCKKISESLKKLKRNKIIIYNRDSVEMFVSEYSFIDFCKINNLPHESFRNSYLKNGERILTTNQSKSQLKNKEHLIYENWYAKKV